MFSLLLRVGLLLQHYYGHSAQRRHGVVTIFCVKDLPSFSYSLFTATCGASVVIQLKGTMLQAERSRFLPDFYHLFSEFEIKNAFFS